MGARTYFAHAFHKRFAAPSERAEVSDQVLYCCTGLLSGNTFGLLTVM